MKAPKSLGIVFLIAAPFVLALICLGFGRYNLSVSETLSVLLAGPQSGGNRHLAFAFAPHFAGVSRRGGACGIRRGVSRAFY